MSEIKVGARVYDEDCHQEWATIRAVSENRFQVDWDDGTSGDEWWDAKAWKFDQPNDPRQAEGPVRTVTRREIVRGRYGRLDVGYVVNVPDCDRPDEPPRVEVEIELTGGCGFTADELDAAARTLQQLAEALREETN